MTPTLVCLVPVLDRPQNIEPLVTSFLESLNGENVEAAMLFLANPEDKREIAELHAHGCWTLIVPWQNGPKDYTRKMNHGTKHTTSDWILLGADDLCFHPGWFRAAISKHIETGALVVGTNDMANPLVKAGKHATHPLVHRDYVKLGTIDNPDELLHSGYAHNSVDVEFCETAISRGQFVFAPNARVQHLHPTFDRTVKRDATYLKGLRYALLDKQLCNRRRSLWNPDAAVRVQMPRRVTTPAARRRQQR